MITIAGIGTAAPPGQATREQSLEVAEEMTGDPSQARSLRALYRRTGVTTRGSVLIEPQPADERGNGGQTATGTLRQTFFAPPSRAAPHGPGTAERMQRYAGDAAPLARDAAARALADASTDPADVTHLVTVSCTGFDAPGVDEALIRTLSLSPQVERVQVGFMGCHGFINGLRVAKGLCAEGGTVLVCSVELCTLHLQYGTRSDDLVANSLFADGAAAAVVRPDAQKAPWQLAATGSTLVPDSRDAMEWHIGNHGFRMILSPRVPELIGQYLRPWITTWLQKHGVAPSDVAGWAVHPGGPRVLSAVTAALDLPRDAVAASRAVLASHGNMSSATVLFVLERLRQDPATARPCVCLAFGPGLTAEAALLL